MNRIITALALSGLFVAAPAFAKTHSNKPVASAGDKAAAADKGEAKTEAPADATAKPAKKVKKSKKAPKAAKTEGATEQPTEAPAK